ncbi:hypothetical protein [Streptosporangium vulgare]
MVAFTVLASLAIHGISASPVMNRLDRLRDKKSDENAEDAEPAAQHL